jgi:ABC-2 type transport system ATP-binding protein
VPAIEVEGLVKDYPRFRTSPTRALDGLDLSVPEGCVFGFLGPNGSGKTTAIRCLLGLARPTAGVCRVLGSDSWTDATRVIHRIGSLVGAPALFPSFSGRRNLALLARLQGIGPQVVEQVLRRVGLAGRGDDLTGAYSQGMLQRLGIAAALLKDPALLILDEPANGLDPSGMKEIRDLLRRLGDDGRTVFVSSHILSEVEQICDRIAIVSRGRCVAVGSVAEILSGRPARGLVVRVGDLDAGLSALHAAGVTSVIHGELIHVDLPRSEAAAVAKILADEELYPVELRPVEGGSLESSFLALTEGEMREGDL